MSPRQTVNLESGMLRLMNQTHSACVFVGGPGLFHRTRFAIQQKCFHAGMRFSPLGKGAPNPAFTRDVEAYGEFADVMENQKASRCEGRIPELELVERRAIFVGAV